tara:strand:+ start:629 stop:772 length:144 start_codon:yes stop_codon:yes gene_type:complete
MEYIALENIIMVSFFLLVLFGLGIACGMYIAGQIEISINKRIKDGNK